MGNKIRILIIIFIFILPYHVFAQEKDKIIWVESDFPPVWITAPPYQGKGGADLIQKLLFEKLNEYEHERIVANITRFQQMLEHTENACSCAVFKTSDREKYMYFNTVPSSFITANGIITKKSNRHLFKNNDTISLANTLKNQKLLLGVSKDRKFGGQIDQVLENFKSSSNIYNRAAIDQTKGLIAMLLSDRVDYILGYDWELQYLVKQLWSSKEADELIFLPIQETPPYLISYIACPKTEWGKKVVNRIDEILKEEIHKKEYRIIWEQWMSDKELYRKLYNKVFLEKLAK